MHLALNEEDYDSLERPNAHILITI